MKINMFLRRHCITLLFLLAVPAIVQAQFTIITNYNNAIDYGAVTITGYHGPGGTVMISDFYTNDYTIIGIGTNAFAYSTNLTAIAIPSGVTSIGPFACAYCSNLTAAYFDGNAPVDNGNAFYGDPNVVVYYESGTTGWGAMFGGAPTMAETPASDFETTEAYFMGTIESYLGPIGIVVVPGEMTDGRGDDWAITNIYSPFDTSVFNNATSVTLPNTVTSIGAYAFDYNDITTNVTLPNSLISIGTAAFANCILTSINIPGSVTSIGGGAFFDCFKLSNITIPGSVTNIGGDAFQLCRGLKSAYFEGNAPPDNGTAFAGSPTTVYYLPGTTGWTNTWGGAPTALWLPTVSSFEPSLGVQNYQFSFLISWAPNTSVIVEACTNLENPNWVPLATNVLSSGTNYFSDPQWANYPNRFYRVSGQ